MPITTLPPCPTCEQSYTGVYDKHLGCTRCGQIGATAKPEPAKVEQ